MLSWVGKIPWKRRPQPTRVFLPGKSQGQRSLAGYSPWGRRESDGTERLADPLTLRATRLCVLPCEREEAWLEHQTSGSCGTGSGKEQGFEGRWFGIYISAPCVTLGKLLKVSILSFPRGLGFGVCSNARSWVFGLHVEDSMEPPAVGGGASEGCVQSRSRAWPGAAAAPPASPLPPAAGPV